MYRALSEVRASGVANIVLVAQLDTSERPASPSRPRLYSLYTEVDRRLFGWSGPAGPRIRPPGESPTADACAPCDVTDVVDGADVVRLGSIDAASRLLLSNDDVERLLPYRLDVAVTFTCTAVAAASLAFARWGVWSHHVGAAVDVAAPPGFWEVMEQAPVTVARLEASLPNAADPVAICRADVATDRYSVARNQDNVLWTCASFLRPALEGVHAGAFPSPEDLAGDELPLPVGDAPRSVPTDGQMVVALSRHAVRLVEDRVRHRFLPQRWTLAFHAGEDTVPLHRFTPLAPPAPQQWADPFPVLFEGELHLFFEEQLSPAEPARISVMKMGTDGTWGEPVPVVEDDHHLSFPHVFRWNECFYMVPETQAVRQVQLYRCRQFPFAWERDRVLLDDFQGVDATVTEWDGVWWMFVNSPASGARNSEQLHIFFADTPLGPWESHVRNPVSSDARTTRSAGRIFRWRDRLFRPAQDCGGQYGRAVVVNEVLRLDREGFEERCVGRLDPNWDRRVTRVHTFNRVPGLTVVDCLVTDSRRPRRAGPRPSA